jgi:hypothetical protein
MYSTRHISLHQLAGSGLLLEEQGPLQEALSSLNDTRDPHQSLAAIHGILTIALFEKSMPISRSKMSRLARVCEI